MVIADKGKDKIFFFSLLCVWTNVLHYLSALEMKMFERPNAVVTLQCTVDLLNPQATVAGKLTVILKTQ